MKITKPYKYHMELGAALVEKVDPNSIKIDLRWKRKGKHKSNPIFRINSLAIHPKNGLNGLKWNLPFKNKVGLGGE